MAAEDAEDEAALKRAAARSPKLRMRPAPDLSAEDAREQAIQNVLLASEDKNPVAESAPPVESQEDESNETASASILDDVPFDVTTHEEDSETVGVVDDRRGHTRTRRGSHGGGVFRGGIDRC